MPSYLEAFQRGAKDRADITGFLRELFDSGLVPDRIDTGYFISIDKEDVYKKLLEFVNTAPEATLSRALAVGKKWFK
jgi:hypothetical protein